MSIAIWLAPALVLLGSYFLGSIPFGLIVTRLAGEGDIRTMGSGNIGATNVLRTGRKSLAALTLILDAAKGAAAVLIAGFIDPSYAPLAAAGSFVGHLFPVWLGFRGGKGVATLLGITLALAWPVGLIYAAVWLAALGLTRTSSVGGMTAAISAPVATSAFGHSDLVLLLLPLSLLVIWKHRANIARLLDGTEPRIGKGGKS